MRNFYKVILMQKNKREIMIFGEVLFDCFPDGKQVLGGAPFNVAWHCQAFGLQPELITRVGSDAAGDKILAAMREWGMSVTHVQRDWLHPTGKVEVSFDDGEPQYDIVADSAWDFIDVRQLPDFSSASLLYHGSLAFRQPVSAQCLAFILNSDCDRFVDVNLRAPWWSETDIKKLLDGARWVKLNRLEQQELSLQSIAAELILTAGDKGAEWIYGQGECVRVRPDTQVPVVDTVGAGDAFSSVVLLGLSRQWLVTVILERAQQFASAVAGIQGAISHDAAFYQPFIEQWRLTEDE